jgi:phage I-like protein
VIQRNRSGTALCKADISLSAEGKAPTEIRLLKYGENESDYGPFVFDELAAALVMASFGTKGISRIYADWNHEMLPKYEGERISREQGKSSCNFVPEVRSGELWASDIQWTEKGREDVESHEYNLFSPAFRYDFSEDDGLCRPRKLLNFALVNMAGLNGIAPLIAAMAKHEETDMEFEKLYNETKIQLEAANAKIKTLEHAGGEVVALSAALGLRGEVGPNSDRLSTVQGLVTLKASVFKIAGQDTPETAIAALQGLATLRTSVLKIAGQDTPEGAIAALQAMKTNSEKVVALEAKLEADTATALTAELAAVFEPAMKDGRLPPADKVELETVLLDFTGGKVTPKVIAAAKTAVAKLSAKVNMENNPTKAPGGGIRLSPERLEIARQMGRDVSQIQAYEAGKAAGAGTQT